MKCAVRIDDGKVGIKGGRHLNRHDAPARDQLTEKRLFCHFVEVLVPEAGELPHVRVRNLSGFGPEGPANKAGNYWGAYDLGLHDAYLVLAAKDMGYDTLIMGIRDAGAIREKLSIPENEEIMSVIAVGKAAEAPAPRPRKAPEEVIRFF